MILNLYVFRNKCCRDKQKVIARSLFVTRNYRLGYQWQKVIVVQRRAHSL